MKKYITWLLTLAMLISIIPSNLLIAYGATNYQYAYLISGVGMYVERRANGDLWVEGNTNTGGIALKQPDGTYTIDASSTTFYPEKVLVDGITWKGENFKFQRIYSHKSLDPKSSRFFGGLPGNIPTEGDLDEIINGKLGIHDELWANNTDNLVPNEGGSTFRIQFKFTPAQYKAFPIGQKIRYVVISILEYKSTKMLADDDYSEGGGGGGGPVDPPEEPSEGRVRAILEGTETSLNYMNMNGKVTATAEAWDESIYNGRDFLDYFNMTLTAFGTEITTESAEQGGNLKAKLDGKISQPRSRTASWLFPNPDGLSYYYTASLRAYLKLTDGSSDSDIATVRPNVYLENDPPTTSFNLKTNDLNGGSVQPNFFYVNTPTTIRVSYSDPEDDIQFVDLSLGLKEDMDKGFAQLIYQKFNGGEERYLVDDYSLTVTNVQKDLYGYTATVVFKRPGVYSHRAQIVDGKSYTKVQRQALSEGTFVVKGEPAAPTAIITSPQYAFENEPFRVTQASIDPNGVDDIVVYNWTNAVDVTREHDADAAADSAFKPITNVSNNWPGNGTVNGKNGGTLTFPTGSAHHYFKITLGVKDATNLTSNTEQAIKVISNVPVASLTADKKADGLKENRKIVISASESLAPQTDPIQWADAVWTIEAVSGGTNANIHEDTAQRNGNKQRTLQFDKPGVYKVTVKLTNRFSKDNPGHEDITASTVSMLVTVVEDKAPLSSVSVISSKPNFIDNPVNHTVKFRVVSSSNDGDIITAPTAYNWVLYEDFNNDGNYTDDEIIPQNRLTFNAEKTEVALGTNYEQGRHNKIKAVVTTTESYAEPFIAKFLSADGSHVRKTSVSTVEVVNWIPKPVIIPPDSSNIDTPYEDADIDGDGILDGKFIRAYTDDIFSVNTKITDEFPANCQVTWELYKKEPSGAFNPTTGGTPWISSSYVTQTLGHDGGSLKINSPGIYRLKMIVKDDCGDTAENTVMIRIYTLPKAVLETNPTYQIKSGNPWYTKENIRFDLRSNPTIVDDEWGKAWHTMNWDLDNWDVKPLSGQNSNEIHFMNPQYTGRYTTVFPSDLTKFSGRNSPLGFGVVVDKPIDIVVMPGLLGNPKDDNNLQLDDTEKQQLYAAADALAAKLRAKDKRYNVKVYKTWAAQDTNDLFRTPEMYGFFDPFTNTGDDEKNMYTKSYTSEVNDTATNTGKNVVIADLNKMNTDNCKFGVMDLMTAYEEKHPEVAGIEFTGTAKVYVNGTLISDCPNKSTWKNIASMEVLPDGTWKIQGNLGVSVICSGDTEIKTEFTGGTLWTSVATRGWGGIYNDEYKMVTHEKSMLDTLKSQSLRSNATKLVIYAANKYTNTTEFRPDTNVATDERCQALGDYLNANQMHFMAVVPGNLSAQMDAFYNKLTVNGATFGSWIPYGGGTQEFIGNTMYNYILNVATLVDNTQYRSCAFTAPGRYEITYWGTNYGGKVTKPVTYQIEVEPDIAPIISGDVAEKFLRDPSDLYNGKYRATIALTGPYSSRLGRDVLTITSPDGDYIDHTTVDVIWDANNNKIFTDSTDKKWRLTESTGTQLGDLYYVLNKLKAR